MHFLQPCRKNFAWGPKIFHREYEKNFWKKIFQKKSALNCFSGDVESSLPSHFIFFDSRTKTGFFEKKSIFLRNWVTSHFDLAFVANDFILAHFCSSLIEDFCRKKRNIKPRKLTNIEEETVFFPKKAVISVKAILLKLWAGKNWC